MVRSSYAITLLSELGEVVPDAIFVKESKGVIALLGGQTQECALVLSFLDCLLDPDAPRKQGDHLDAWASGWVLALGALESDGGDVLRRLLDRVKDLVKVFREGPDGLVRTAAASGSQTSGAAQASG
eukprot:4811686-Pyramimonas_sp.AAC.1